MWSLQISGWDAPTLIKYYNFISCIFDDMGYRGSFILKFSHVNFKISQKITFMIMLYFLKNNWLLLLIVIVTLMDSVSYFLRVKWAFVAPIGLLSVTNCPEWLFKLKVAELCPKKVWKLGKLVFMWDNKKCIYFFKVCFLSLLMSSKIKNLIKNHFAKLSTGTFFNHLHNA